MGAAGTDRAGGETGSASAFLLGGQQWRQRPDRADVTQYRCAQGGRRRREGPCGQFAGRGTQVGNLVPARVAAGQVSLEPSAFDGVDDVRPGKAAGSWHQGGPTSPRVTVHPPFSSFGVAAQPP
jgi:hypothetical protein